MCSIYQYRQKWEPPRITWKYPPFRFLTFPIKLLDFISTKIDFHGSSMANVCFPPICQSPPISWLLAWYRLNLGNWCVVIKHLLKVWWSKRNCCCFEMKVQVVCDIVWNTLWKDWTKQRCNEKKVHEHPWKGRCSYLQKWWNSWKKGHTLDWPSKDLLTQLWSAEECGSSKWFCGSKHHNTETLMNTLELNDESTRNNLIPKHEFSINVFWSKGLYHKSLAQVFVQAQHGIPPTPSSEKTLTRAAMENDLVVKEIIIEPWFVGPLGAWGWQWESPRHCPELLSAAHPYFILLATQLLLTEMMKTHPHMMLQQKNGEFSSLSCSGILAVSQIIGEENFLLVALCHLKQLCY